MNLTAVHVAVFDTLADWEIGYATAHIRRDSWQREPGRYPVVTVGPIEGLLDDRAHQQRRRVPGVQRVRRR